MKGYIYNATKNEREVLDTEKLRLILKTEGNRTVIDGGKIMTGSIVAKSIAADSIYSEMIVSDAIKTGHVSAGTIISEHIQANQILANHIKADQIDANHIKSNSILTKHLTTESILAQHIQTNTITADRIKTGEVIIPNEKYGGVYLNNTGLNMINPANNILLSNEAGLKIHNNYTNKTVLWVNPNTGNIEMDVEKLTIQSSDVITKDNLILNGVNIIPDSDLRSSNSTDSFATTGLVSELIDNNYTRLTKVSEDTARAFLVKYLDVSYLIPETDINMSIDIQTDTALNSNTTAFLRFFTSNSFIDVPVIQGNVVQPGPLFQRYYASGKVPKDTNFKKPAQLSIGIAKKTDVMRIKNWQVSQGAQRTEWQQGIDYIPVYKDNILLGSNISLESKNELVVDSKNKNTNNLEIPDQKDIQFFRNQTVTVSVDINVRKAKLRTNNPNTTRVGFELSVVYTDGTTTYLNAWERFTDGKSFQGRITNQVKILNKEIKSISNGGIYIQAGAEYAYVGKPKIILGGYPENNEANLWNLAKSEIPSNEEVKAFFNLEKEKIELGINTKFEDVYTKGQTNTQIDLAKDEINLGVKKEINNIKVGATNLLIDSEAPKIKSYLSSIIKYEENIYVDNWKAKNAVKHNITGGTSSIIGVLSAPNKTLKDNTNYIHSIYIKNTGNKKVGISPNAGETEWIEPLEIKRVILSRFHATNVSSMQFVFYRESLSDSLEFVIWHAQIEEGTIVTDWSPCPEDSYTKYETDARIKIETDNINLSVKDSKYLSKAAEGLILFKDIYFEETTNDIQVYNNSGNSNVVITREVREEGNTSWTNPSGRSTRLLITHLGQASPGLGGIFFYKVDSRANAKFIFKMTANLPTGYWFELSSNAIGKEGTYKWLTDNKGNGTWKEYIGLYECGQTGEFKNLGHVYVDGKVPSSSAPLKWWIDNATVIDITNSEKYATEAEIREVQLSLEPDNISQTVTSSNTFSQWSEEALGEKADQVDLDDTNYHMNGLDTVLNGGENENGEKVEGVVTTVSQLKTKQDGLEYSLTTTQKTVSKQGEDIREVRDYMTFDENGLTIGKSTSPFAMNLSNTKLAFKDGDAEVAYLDKQKLYIEQAQVLQSIIVGQHMIQTDSITGQTIFKFVGKS